MAGSCPAILPTANRSSRPTIVRLGIAILALHLFAENQFAWTAQDRDPVTADELPRGMQLVAVRATNIQSNLQQLTRRAADSAA